MQYCWDDYCLDRHGTLLTRGGEQIDISRRQLDCITHLIEERHRVVHYDELIQRVWGHENVTNHQLAQIVLSVRRVLGDNGRAQRLVRTMPGLGYRWIGQIEERSHPVVSVTGSPPETPSPTPTRFEPQSPLDMMPAGGQAAAIAFVGHAEAPAADALRIHSARWIAWLVASVLAFSTVVMYVMIRGASVAPIASPAPTANADTIAALEALLHAGRYEDLRQGLARLPPEIADSPQARLLEVYLDIARGRTPLALQKLEEEQARADVAQDPLWQARIMIARGNIHFKEGRPSTEIKAAAQSALGLLESMDDAAPPGDVGNAIIVRAYGFSLEGRLDEAMRDYVRAKEIFATIGDLHGMSRARSNLARVWIRTGQLQAALDELQDIRSTIDPMDLVNEIYTLNTISQIQMELLRKDEALKTSDDVFRLLRNAPDSDRRHRALMMRAFILSESGRLREAASQLEEAGHAAGSQQTLLPSIEAMYYIASGSPAEAIKRLQRGFGAMPQNGNFVAMLEDVEGFLLLWTIAARDLAAQGEPFPDLPAAQKTTILNPRTATGHIARGRWLWAQGDQKGAEADFRLALDAARREGHNYRMTLAGEALIELLLWRGDAVGAKIVMETVQSHLSSYADSDYRTNLLALRIALALEDTAAARAAYQRARALAVERRLPADIAKQYALFSAAHGPAAGRVAVLGDDTIAKHLD